MGQYLQHEVRLASGNSTFQCYGHSTAYNAKPAEAMTCHSANSDINEMPNKARLHN